ncbi:MAG: large subunit ribosomal protein [Thermoplasmata archaeon]|jgi:large subunit ribosomal protein L29|nr:large subunit ribosomal protein [Thermoplasmata archaeon]
MLKAQEVRAMNREDRKTRLVELHRELMQERGVQAMGGSTPNPGKIRTLRREIARILTIQNEDRHGIVRGEAAATPAKGKKESKK